MDIKIGADPEVFLFDTITKNYVSAAGFFPGTKKNPFKVDGGAIQVDGIALEFNIDPADSEKDFLDKIKTVHLTMEKMVADVNKDWVVHHVPLVHIPKGIWEKVPLDNQELGCDPDYNISGTVNENPTDRIVNAALNYKVGAIRTGSGHLHIGWSDDESVDDPQHFEDCRACSAFFHGHNVYRPTTTLESERLAFYGHSGAFRPKKYGVELRTPSNMWLNNDQSIKDTFRKTKENFDKFANGEQ